ncbi:hypothetical protein H7I76_32175 [Mycolicibacterium vaccae]|nr:hypothetical protein [Mycolicibacterium vaccae]
MHVVELPGAWPRLSAHGRVLPTTVPMADRPDGYPAAGRNRLRLLDRTRSHEPTGAAPAAATISPISLVPVSITRTGKEITLQGEFPDAKARAALLDAVDESVGSTANVVDNLGINPDVNSLDFSDAALVFNTAAAIPDFRLSRRRHCTLRAPLRQPSKRTPSCKPPRTLGPTAHRQPDNSRC